MLLAQADDKSPTKNKTPFTFRDLGDEAGLFPHVANIRGHSAGWGDVDGDGWVDLYVGTFHNNGSKPNLFFRNKGGKFQRDEQPALQISTRSTAALFADLDNDGDLDLYVGSMPSPAKANPDAKDAHAIDPCTLFRNDGDGKFTNISADNGACPPAFGARSATVLDYDGDGLLDLLVGEDPLPGYNGSTTKSSRLFHNEGNLQFKDVSREVGLTADVPGYGVAAADVNNDGWPDFFLAANRGGNVLFLNDGHGKFREAPGSREFFAWETSTGDNMIAGVCFCDLNRDGLLDIVIGQHYSRPWQKAVPIRLYLNRGIKDGNPTFEDITEAAGLTPLAMKAPHVEIQDFDNDGWPDIYCSIVKFSEGKPYPVIYKHLGIRDGLPRFRDDAFAVNDFPTAEDATLKQAGKFFDKMIQEKKIIYMAPGPSADYDNDGKLDLFLANWWIESRSLLLHNETPGGHWLQVQFRGERPETNTLGNGINSFGIGSRIEIYPAGKSGMPSELIGCREIASGFGYASCQPAIAHFGLGEIARVDIKVTLPHGKGKLLFTDVAADQRFKVAKSSKPDGFR